MDRTPTTPTTPTTEPPRPPAFAAFSVRARLTLVIALLTAAAMTASGLLVSALESASIEREISEQIDQEIEEFRELQRRGIDPQTGRPFDDVESLLLTFLGRNVPDDDEMLVAYTPSDRDFRTDNRYGSEILRDSAYIALVEELRAEGGTRVLDSPEFGEVWVTVIPVRNSAGTGELAIINFVDDERDELTSTMRTYTVVALLSLGLITALAALQSGRLLRPLRTLRETANDISASDLSRRIPEVGNDDITALTRTINTMLDRLEGGFEAQRQFLDDAGHELKTPLTVLSGHLELLDVDDPDEVAETRDLLLDEVERMARLVDDLILLAKSRRPDFIQPAPVDLARLTTTLAAKASALGDREWLVDSVADAEVPMDEQRITQAVLQLADNAVKHTDTGAQIAIGSASEGGVARIWVRDTGDGVPVADRDRIFDRFARSETRDDDEGFGLGLSIVTAIVEAHRGAIRLRPSKIGAHFEITLPIFDSSGPLGPHPDPGPDNPRSADPTSSDPKEHRWHRS